MCVKPEFDTYQKFVKLLQFVKDMANGNLDYLTEYLPSELAKEILEEIGES